MDCGTGEAAVTRPFAPERTEAAEADPAEIWSDTAVEAFETTDDRCAAALMVHFSRPVFVPGSGTPRDQLSPGPRVIVHRAYATYELASASEVEIVRVIDGARDVTALSQRGGFNAGRCSDRRRRTLKGRAVAQAGADYRSV